MPFYWTFHSFHTDFAKIFDHPIPKRSEKKKKAQATLAWLVRATSCQETRSAYLLGGFRQNR
jgi:hypothetical protein